MWKIEVLFYKKDEDPMKDSIFWEYSECESFNDILDSVSLLQSCGDAKIVEIRAVWGDK